MAKKSDVSALYRRMFGSAEGRVILEDLKDQLYYENTTYVQGDQHATVRNEGRRDALLYILSHLRPGTTA